MLDKISTLEVTCGRFSLNLVLSCQVPSKGASFAHIPTVAAHHYRSKANKNWFSKKIHLPVGFDAFLNVDVLLRTVFELASILVQPMRRFWHFLCDTIISLHNCLFKNRFRYS